MGWVANQLEDLGPVGLWLLDDVSGSALADQMGVNPGSYTGVVTKQQTPLTPDAAGQSALFGPDGYLSVPHSSDFQIANDWSFIGWFGPRSRATAAAFFHKGKFDTSGQQGLAIRSDETTGAISAGWFNGAWASIQSGLYQPVGQAFFFAVRYNAAQHRLYFQVGDQSSNVACPQPTFQATVSSPLILGAEYNTSVYRHYSSTLDNLAWFNRCLTDEDLVRAYTQDPSSALLKIAGVTRLDGQIAQATMRLCEAATGAFRAEALSDPGTGEYEFSSSGQQTGDLYWGETRMLLEFENSLGSSGAETWTGTIVGAVTFSTAFKHSGTFSAAFPGTVTAYINYGTDPTGRLDFSGGSFTVEAWVYVTSYPSSGAYRTIVQNLSDSPQGGWRLIINNAGMLHLAHYAASGGSPGFSTIPVPLNTWTHVACAYDAVAGRSGLFVGGVGTYANVVVNIKPAAGYAKALVGVTADLISWKWAGYIDDVRITNGVCRYKSNFTPAPYEKGPQVDSVMAPGETFFVMAHYGEGIRPLAHGPIVPVEAA